jgi:dihydrodipicolinate synthase/N-acetylneuraminate lyase
VALERGKIMQKSDFRGVFPAITTKLGPDQSVDLAGVKADVEFQVEGGVDAIIACGSLGEASSLTREEKLGIDAESRRLARA